eukprot:TRINITY_DN8634_c1_g1_i1.p1 TRINITY_DN8634_c1_g1~~TRINITY_DN8634_c1_g1_i1.p1  ORF type:complete len:348 (+),score=74.64 TRINITY_DN8634_c1_g1_i1:45-1088(+)
MSGLSPSYGSSRSSRGRLMDTTDCHWGNDIEHDEIMRRMDDDGQLSEFAEMTREEDHTGGLFSWLQSFVSEESFHKDKVTELYLGKCAELFSFFDGIEEKVQPEEDASPLGWRWQSHRLDPDPIIEKEPRTKREQILRRDNERKRLFSLLNSVQHGFRASGLDKNDVLLLNDSEAHELGETNDRLEYATRKLWKMKLYFEEEDIMKARFKVVVTCVAEFMLSIVLACLGAQQLNGGREEVVYATFVCAIVGIISSFGGFCASLPSRPNQTMLNFFYSAQVWMMALLTAFMMAELLFIHENNEKCDPSKARYVQRDECDNRAELYSTLGIGALELISVVCLCFLPIVI